jgi:hypothetical protein
MRRGPAHQQGHDLEAFRVGMAAIHRCAACLIDAIKAADVRRLRAGDHRSQAEVCDAEIRRIRQVAVARRPQQTALF